MAQRIRVLLAKVGLDGHDRGVKVVARTLRDAGMDVVYSGLHRSPEEVVSAAVQEDVDVLGVSLLSGVQMTVFPKIFALLKEKGVDDADLVVAAWAASCPTRMSSRSSRWAWPRSCFRIRLRKRSLRR